MFSITLKLMKKNVRMLIPAGIAILIGTAFIAATFLFSNTMNDSLTRQQTALFGQANYVVTVDSDAVNKASAEEQSKAYGTVVGDFNLDRMRAIDGVNDVRADASFDGLSIGKGEKHVTGVAVGSAKETKLLPVSIVSGSQPIDNNEIALPKSMAEQLGVGVGDTVTVNSPAMHPGEAVGADSHGSSGDSGLKVRVTGLTEDPNGAYSYYGGASVLSNNVLAAASGADDFSNVGAYQLYLDIAGADGGKSDEAKAQDTAKRVAETLPKYHVIMTRADADREAMKALSAGGTDISTVFLLSFGVLAMVVAALVIANTFQVLVAQRRRTLALLRTIGAKKGQLYASVLLEAGVLGLIASLLGVALGIGLMAAVCASGLMASTGMDARVILSWQVFVVPLAFGMVMTVLASLGSARSATAVTPLEALRPIELSDTRHAGVVRAVCSGLLAAGGLALAGFAAWQMHESLAGHDSLVDQRYAYVLLAAIAGCALLFFGLVLSAAFWLPLLMRGVGAAVALTGPSAKIAHANIQKNPRRVAATGAALLIGVTLVATIATGAASGKQTMGEALDRRYSVDMIAFGNDMTDKQATDAAETKGVAASVYAPTTMRYVTAENGKELTVLLVGVNDAASLGKVMKADLSGVSIGVDSVLMPMYDAIDGKAITLDKSVTFRSKPAGVGADGSDASSAGDDPASNDGAADQAQPVTLKPQQVDYRRISSNYDTVAFVNADRFTNGKLETTGHMLLMRVDAESAGVTMNDVLTNVQQTFSASPGVSVSGPVAERSMWETIINGMMALLVGLIAVAVLIALVGVANTLSLSVIERTRESATLRAIGMTRGQLRRSLAVEALLLSLVSGVVGVVLGTLFGWLGSYMVFSLYATVALPFDWASTGLVLGVAALAALLASIMPARRAVSVPPVEALAEA